MSRYRVVDAVDSLLGTASPRGEGGVVHSRHGVFTNDDWVDAPDPTSDDGPCTPHRHGKLKGVKRCHGCGRTRNEIEIDGDEARHAPKKEGL